MILDFLIGSYSGLLCNLLFLILHYMFDRDAPSKHVDKIEDLQPDMVVQVRDRFHFLICSCIMFFFFFGLLILFIDLSREFILGILLGIMFV